MQPNRLRFLKVAEYTSLAASVAGVVISTATRQVVYAVAPVSISMFLNLLNRQRFEQQTQQNLAAAIAQVDQQLSQLNRAFSTLQQEVTSELNQQSELQNRFTAIESLSLDTVPQTIVQLQGQFDGLLASVSRIDQRLDSFSSTEQADSFKIEIDQLQTELQQQRNNLQTAITQQQTELQAQFDQRFSQLAQSISVIQQQLQSQESASNSAALESIQQGLTQLQNRIAAVEALNLRSTLQTIAQLQGQYDSLLASTSRIDQRLGNFPSTEQVDSLKAEIDQIQVDLGQLQTNLQQEQNNLQAALEQLQTELQGLLEQSPSSGRNLLEDETLLIEPPTQSRKQIQRLVGSVVMNGYQKHGTHRPVFKSLEFQKGLSVFIGGGGGMTSLYKKAIMDTHSDFQHKNVGIPSYIHRGIPTPKDLSMSGLNPKEFHRFAVAYGLSIPDGGCPEVRLPSEMEKAEPQQLGTTSDSSRLRYEDTRDYC